MAEADLSDYAGMYLAGEPEGQGALVTRLSPLPKEPAVAVRADADWRAGVDEPDTAPPARAAGA